MSRLLAFLFALCAPLPTLATDAGHHHPPVGTPEHRSAIRLDAGEAAHLRLEMRLLLSAVHKIVSGAAHNDMRMVAEAAQSAGMAAAHEVPAGLRQKLPAEFRKLGHLTHVGFDDLARDAASLADANLALRQLDQIMSNCISCHATFRVEPVKSMRKRPGNSIGRRALRSEERRVGKECRRLCRSRWSPYH
jgi:hypothetical protein